MYYLRYKWRVFTHAISLVDVLSVCPLEIIGGLYFAYFSKQYIS